MSPRDRTGPAIAIALLAVLLFDFMGLIIKYLSSDYGAAELAAYRNFFGLIPSAIALWLSAPWRAAGRRLRIRQWRLACLRGLSIGAAQLLFYLSLGLMDFASATTISYTLAIFSTALSALLLRERVGPVRSLAGLVGFLGVVLIMGVGRDSFSWYALLPLGSALLYAFSGVTARKFDHDVPSALLNLHSSLVATVVSVVVALAFGGFSPVGSAADALWILAMGGFGGSAVLCIVIANRMTEPSNVAPFWYFGVPMAFVFGWVFFDEAPFEELFPGAIFVVASGLIIVLRERRLRRRRNVAAGDEAP